LARALATQLPEGLNTLDNAANSDAPAVMLLSRQDRVVPFEFQQRVAHVYRGPSRHLVLPDADHGDPPTASELAAFTEMTHWLWGAVNRPRGNP
jgi:pimeloyl-ACP methyl ester carboxylesterase